jgi:hypothetical protein
MTPQELGALGEAYVMRVLSRIGLQVEQAGPADLLVEGQSIEVKAARPAPYRTRGYTGYQFCLHKPGHTDHRNARAIVLLCYWHECLDPVAFVIPSDRVGDRRKIVIPGQPWTYAGQWSRYYRHWEIIADVLENCESV